MQDLSRVDRIYTLLRSAIESGEYRQGSALPNQAELARQFGASVATLRKALDRLSREGFVEARQGSGTFVRSSEPVRGRVLVVDDDPVTRQMMEEVLDGLGYEVEATASGEEAVARVMRQRYSHVLMDVRMHGIGGLAAAGKIHQIDPSVLVIFVTGHPIDVLDSQQPGLWPAMVLRKPFELSELERTLSVRVS